MSAPITTTSPENTWHERLRTARTARSVSQTDLARAIKVTPPTVCEWESGRIQELKGANLLKVCHYLKIRQDWLLHGRGDMDNTNSPITPQMIADLSPERREAVELMQQLADFQLADIVTTIKKQVQTNKQIITQLTRQ